LHNFATTGEAKGWLLGQWAVANAGLSAVVARKSKLVGKSGENMFRAIVSLVFPLLVCLALKFFLIGPTLVIE